jgi:hypothetical protein
MSYILDALKRAAEQRGEGAPGFRRVVSAPAAPAVSRRTWRRVGAVALCVVAAGAVTFAAFRRASVVTVVAPQPSVVPPQAAVVPPPPAVVAPPPAVVGRAPGEAARAQRPVAGPARVVAPIVGVPRGQTPSPRSAPAARPVVAVTPRPDVPVNAVAPPPAPSAPFPSAPSAPSVTVPGPVAVAGGDVKLKLEVLVYSEVASERMVFINGRKYLQGDTVAEHARVEEIQPDGVVLSEHGRRFTLRH